MVALYGVVIFGSGFVLFYNSLRTIEPGEVEAIVMFGQVVDVLHSKSRFAPVYLSETYPVDPDTMTFDRNGERIEVPEKFEAEIRTASGRTMTEREPTILERIATVLGWSFVVLGVAGLVAATSLLGQRIGYEPSADASWLFPDATLVQAVLILALSLVVIVAGESIRPE